MAMFSGSPDVYVAQWLKTATQGKVLCHKAMFADRYQFVCQVCQQSLTTPTTAVKVDGTVDYSLQEFVKIHAHTGGHNNPIELEKYDGYGKVIPLTADFKKIDDKPENEEKIKAKMAEYVASLNLDDDALAEKIAALQTWEAKSPIGKILPVKSLGAIHSFNADNNAGPWNEQADVDAQIAKTKAIENVLKLKLWKAQLAQKKQIEDQIQRIQGPVGTTVKDKVLTQPVGRKFR